MPQSDTGKGIALMLLAGLFFTLLDATAKGLIASYPAWQVIWARYFGQSVIVALALAPRLPGLLRTRYPGLQALRSALQLGATSCFFFSLAHVGLADATALMELSPVLITLGAALFLAEPIGPRRLAGVGVALAGALIVIRPGGAVFSAPALLPLGAALCFTAYVLLTRRLGRDESVWTSLLYTAALGTVATSALLPAIWQPIALRDLIAFAGLGGLGALAQLFLIRAFTLAEAGAIAPFAYADLLFATLWGVLFFAEFPDGWTVAGGALITGAGLYVWHREMQLVRRAP